MHSEHPTQRAEYWGSFNQKQPAWCSSNYISPPSLLNTEELNSQGLGYKCNENIPGASFMLFHKDNVTSVEKKNRSCWNHWDVGNSETHQLYSCLQRKWSDSKNLVGPWETYVLAQNRGYKVKDKAKNVRLYYYTILEILGGTSASWANPSVFTEMSNTDRILVQGRKARSWKDVHLICETTFHQRSLIY